MIEVSPKKRNNSALDNLNTHLFPINFANRLNNRQEETAVFRCLATVGNDLFASGKGVIK